MGRHWKELTGKCPGQICGLVIWLGQVVLCTGFPFHEITRATLQVSLWLPPRLNPTRTLRPQQHLYKICVLVSATLLCLGIRINYYLSFHPCLLALLLLKEINQVY